MKKRDGKNNNNSHGFEYVAKTIDNNPLISDSVKFNDLEQIEIDHYFIIQVNSETHLIRQSTRTSGHI